MPTQDKSSAWMTAFLACFCAFLVGREAVSGNRHIDFFLYRAGAQLGFQQGSPYDRPALQRIAEEQYPVRDDYSRRLIDNCAFLLAPEAVVLFAPFGVIPYVPAKVVWSILVAGLGATGFFLATKLSRKPISGMLVPLVVGCLLLNPMTLLCQLGGQTTLLAAAFVFLGEWFWRRGARGLSTFLWAALFIKPHVAFPLIPLAYLLNGSSRAGRLVLGILFLNLLGCFLCGRSPLLMIDYVERARIDNATIVFNQVATSPRITSWNRLVFLVGGPEINLTATSISLGYLLFFALAALRCRGKRPPFSWLLAIAAASMPICCQRLDYELVMLALAAPLVLEYLLMGNRPVAFLLMALFAIISLPYEFAEAVLASLPADSLLSRLVGSYHAVLAHLFAATLLCAGWPTSDDANSAH